MTKPPDDSRFGIPDPKLPNDAAQMADPRNAKTFVYSLCALVLGLIIAGVGFYEISIYNTVPERPWGIVVFIIGLVLLTIGTVGVVTARFSDGFSSYRNRPPI